MKETIMATNKEVADRLDKLETENQVLREKLVDKDSVISELQGRVDIRQKQKRVLRVVKELKHELKGVYYGKVFSKQFKEILRDIK